MTRRLVSILVLALLFPLSLAAKDPKNPTWWEKYQFLLKNGADPSPGATASALSAGTTPSYVVPPGVRSVDTTMTCEPSSATSAARSVKFTMTVRLSSSRRRSNTSTPSAASRRVSSPTLSAGELRRAASTWR